nr:MAG TPA: hypothetical protein [Caudoviricetes sp.]
MSIRKSKYFYICYARGADCHVGRSALLAMTAR